MSDPRNVAHAKKVVQQKHHQETKSSKSKKRKKSNVVAAVNGQLTQIATTQPPLPNQNKNTFPASTKNRWRFFPSSKTWSFIPRRT